MRRFGGLAALAAVALALPLVATGAAFPDKIDLPPGWQPEGIATEGTSFYSGSRLTGAVWKGDLRTGDGFVLVPPQAGRSATGLKVDAHGRLFVAGAGTGKAFVYDARTGANIAEYTFAPTATFVNDVVVTKDAAWFTESNQTRQVLYKVPIGPGGTLGAAETVPLTGDIQYAPGFNVNGIDATPDGETLVLVQSNTGFLFTADTSGVTQRIDLEGSLVATGDGILLDGKTLYVVVRTPFEEVVVIRLSPDLRSGAVVDALAHPDFDNPTTVAEHGDRLYVINARFTTPPTPSTPYWVTMLRK